MTLIGNVSNGLNNQMLTVVLNAEHTTATYFISDGIVDFKFTLSRGAKNTQTVL
jgi:hypothetical protein